MRLRADAENFRRLVVGGSGVVAGVGLVEPPYNMARSSAICVSMWSCCCSKPTMAALMISGVSFCVGMCDVLSGFSLSCFYCWSHTTPALSLIQEPIILRSEERRVGKEG